MSPDLHSMWLTAGDSLHPAGDSLTDFGITYGPGLALAATIWLTARTAGAITGAATRTAHRLAERRRLRHTPAADDNTEGRDHDALNTCRRINNQPASDPDISRRADHYLREQQRKEKP